MGYHHQSIAERSSAPIRKIPSWKRAQPLRHFHLTLTAKEHTVLRRAASKCRGFSHTYIRYPDDDETIIQGRNCKAIIADIRALFPDIEIDIRSPEFYMRSE